MKEGKELLVNILEDKLNKLSQYSESDIVYDGLELKSLLSSLDDYDNLTQVTDKIIDEVFAISDIDKKDSYSKLTKGIRDLLVGKNEYNVTVSLSPSQQESVLLFKTQFDSSLRKEESIFQQYKVNILTEKCNDLLYRMRNKIVIADLDFIYEITDEYNRQTADANLVHIMEYINKHNVDTFKETKRKLPEFNIQYIRRPKIDDRIKDVLDKIGIEYKDLPSYLVGELKRTDVNNFIANYNLVSRKKAENYGILHLIKGSNILSRLVLLLYATPDSIKTVVDSIKDSNDAVDVSTLKILCNNALSCFLIINNEYFKPKNNDFINNINFLKSVGVNYRALINKNPLYTITNSQVINYVLTYLTQLGATSKKVINKCYKTLSINPSLLIENIDVLRKYNVDIKKFLEGENYNLLKITKLDIKIKYIKEIDSSIITRKGLNIDKFNKMAIGNLYLKAKKNKPVWSDFK